MHKKAMIVIKRIGEEKKIFIPVENFIKEENGFLYYKSQTKEGRKKQVRITLDPRVIEEITRLGDYNPPKLEDIKSSENDYTEED